MQSNKILNVGEIRQQCALKNSDVPVIIKLKIIKNNKESFIYLKGTRCFPDTFMAPAGEGFYIEASLEG